MKNTAVDLRHQPLGKAPLEIQDQGTDQGKAEGELAHQSLPLPQRAAELEHTDDGLKQLEWLMHADENFEFGVKKDERYTGQNYGDLVQLNCRERLRCLRLDMLGAHQQEEDPG